MAKADNLLAVLWLLRSRRRLTAEQLAAALETSVRTVYRYIDALCASGVPIVADPGPAGGYSLPEPFRGAPLFFEPDELVALFQAAAFAREAGHPYSDALDTALGKVQRNLAPEQAQRLQRHTAVLGLTGRRRGGPVQPWLAAVEAAAAEGATLRLLYQKPGAAEPEERVVDPYALAYRAGCWYAVAYCHTRHALRDFRVDRIRALARTGGAFQRSPDFSLQDHHSEAWMQARLQAGPLTTVRLAGNPTSLESICEHWYMRHCLVQRSPEAACFRIDPVGLANLAGYLLGFGRNVRVLEPDALRSDLADLATAWAAHHRGEP